MVAAHERAEARGIIGYRVTEDGAVGFLVEHPERADGEGGEHRYPAEDDISAATAESVAQREQEEPRRTEDHHQAPGVHRRLLGVRGGERGVESRRQPAHVILQADVELPDIDAGHALRRPEGLAVDDHTPGVEVLHREIREERHARPERHRAEEFGARFGGRTRDQVAREQEPRERRAGEQRGREAHVVEPAIGERLMSGRTGDREPGQQTKEGDRHHDALRARLDTDGEEGGGGETERGGDRPEHDAGPTPRRDDQDETREDHHGAFTGGEGGMGGHENKGTRWHVGQGTRGRGRVDQLIGWPVGRRGR